MERIIVFLTVIAFTAIVTTTAYCAEMPQFMPKITDVTAFKDGHALVMSRAETTLEDGWCRTRDVPAPVLGTFWAFTTDKNAKVEYVRAGFVDSENERPCLDFIEIIQANKGKEVEITEHFGQGEPITHAGIIEGILEKEIEKEVERVTTAPATYDPYGRYRNPENIRTIAEEKSLSRASFVMLKTAEGVDLVGTANIRGIRIKDQNPVTTTKDKKKEREISMRIMEKGKPAKGKSEVGIVYMQKGVRWIPNYSIELLDDGKAKVTLRAEIINELADLDNINLHLVVGVPSFIMKDNISSLALRETALNLSSYFQPPAQGGRRGDRYDYLSNVMMSQTIGAYSGEPAGGASRGPDVPSEGQTEDLFLYEQKNFSLKKGERAIVNLVEMIVPYEDIYVWDVPIVPPAEMWRNLGSDRIAELARTLMTAKAMHKVRLTNNSEVPLTTGPAIIFKNGAVLGQNIITYTSIKNSVDVPITVATDINTSKEEVETGRTPNITINSDQYFNVKMHGKLTVKNFKDKEVHVIVNRTAIGKITSANANGKITQQNMLEDTSSGAQGYDGYYPWYYWSWPWWWYHLNQMSKVTWDVKIPAGEDITLEYDWNYYYR